MNNLKRKLLSFLVCTVCCFTTLGSCLATTYASNEPEAPEGYYLYKKIPLSDGNIQYVYISNDYQAQSVQLGEYDENNNKLSFSPQMTYSLYGTGSNESDVGDDALDSAVLNFALQNNIDVTQISADAMSEIIMNLIDKSESFSNSFAYSGVPDEDSYVVSAVDNDSLSGFSAYANYYVCQRAGISDWYVFVSNALSWNNCYNHDYFGKYKNDMCTFNLLNNDNPTFIGRLRDQYCTSRWYQDNVAVSDYHRILFQTTAQSVLTSGMLVLDIYNTEMNAKVPAKEIFANLAGGSWDDVLSYGKYKKIHGDEAQPINNNAVACPVDSIVNDGNNIIFNLNNKDYGNGHFGYYVDYLVHYTDPEITNLDVGSKYSNYRIYRHYFFPDDSKVSGNTYSISYNSLESQLPFTDNSLDGSVDNTLILGIGGYEYWTSDGRYATMAPTRTKGLGDIEVISSYTYYTFKYPFKHSDFGKYGYDLKTVNPVDVPCINIVFDPQTNTIVTRSDDVIDYHYDGTLGTKLTDYNTYVDDYVTKEVDNVYINVWNTTIINTNISDDDKAILTKLASEKNNSSSGDTVPESGYFNRWSEWITEMRNFIINVPELLKYLWSWLPDELQVFIVASIATGFGVAVVKNILHKE